MHNHLLPSLATALVLTVTGFAQTAVSTTSTTTTAGTISEFSPDTIVVRTEAATEPVRYSYSKTTTYVDEAGAPVSMDVVKSGLPVTVYYVKEGDRMVASRVMVRKSTTTTSGGAAVVQEKSSTTAVSPAVTEKRSTTTIAPAPAIEEKKTTTTTTTK